MKYKTETVNIDSVKTNPSNPRTIKAAKHAALVKSIKDFPQMLDIRPLVVDKKGFVIGGNMRLSAAKEAGLTKIPILRAESLTPAQIKEFIIKDNVGFGEWEWDALLEQYSTDDLQEWGLDVPEFAGPDGGESSDDGYEEPDDLKTDIKTGDIVEIGHHVLICGDSTDPKYWEMLKIQGGCIGFTSPPYNAGGTSKIQSAHEAKRGSKYINNSDNMRLPDYTNLLQSTLKNCLSFCDGAAWNVQPLAGNKSALFRWVSSNEDIFNDLIIWDKGSAAPPMAKSVLTSRYEWICVFSKNNKSRTIPLSSWRGTVSNVYSAPPQRNNEYAAHHNATFPVHLPSFVIADLMNRCTAVVDCFMGTGTTMVAAHQLGRKSYGIEMEPRYCAVIIDRMKKLDQTLEVKKNGKPYKTGN